MQNINLDIVPGDFLQVLRFSQGDIGREFKINLVNYDIPAGATVKLQGTKPSGFGFTITNTGSITNNAITLASTSEMTSESGKFPAEVHIEKDGVKLGTANLYISVEKNPHPNGTTDGNAEEIIPELTLLVERVEAAASSILDMQVVANTLPAGSQATYSYDEELNKATFGIPQGEAGAGAAGVVASAYSASSTYAVGDYVIHNGNLYRCTTAITTAEAFTAAHWTQIVLADDVSDLKSDLKRSISELGEGNILKTDFVWEVGTIYKGSDIYNTKTYRTKGYYPTSEVDYVESLSSSYVGTVFYYTDNQGTYADAYTSFNSSAGLKKSINKDYPYYRIIFAKSDYSALPDLDDIIVYKIADFQESIDELLEREADLTALETETAKIKQATVTVINEETTETLSMTDKSSLSTAGEVITGGQSGWATSDEVDISSYDSLVITAGSGYNHLLYAFYDESHTFLSGLNSGSSVLNITSEAVSIPSGAKYVRLAKNANASASLKGINITYENSALARWKGKKWTVVGDSLTEVNARTTKHYHDYIADATGITVVNMGVSGTGYMAGQGSNNAFYQRISNVPIDSDVVTILGSCNDGTLISDLGTATDTGTSTIGGCINTTLDNLYAIMPVVQLGIIAPAPVVGANPYTQPYFNDYVDLLEEICKRRSIPFLNLYYESNLRPWDSTFRTLAYSKDDGNGVHPDETGHAIIAPRIMGFLDSLLL